MPDLAVDTSAAPRADRTGTRGAQSNNATAAPATARMEVIYILGCGRSGSTLLDLVLGAHDRVASLGEVWYHRRWARHNFACTCGAAFQACDFWQSVAARLRAGAGEVLVAPVLSRAAKLTALARLLLLRKFPTAEQAHGYADATYRLFAAAQEVSGKPVILDSSKNPMRLLFLHASGLFHLKAIHLIRDGRAYLHSTSKPVLMPAQGGQMAPAQSAWRASWRWLLTNALSSLVCARLPAAASCTIRYEDFARDPRALTARLCAFLDLPFSPALLEEGPGVAHNISGSRWRFQAGRAIRLDEKWRTELAARRHRIFSLLAGWLNRRYGYS